MQSKKNNASVTQRQQFIDAAREVETDEAPEAFKDRLKKLAKAPVPKTVLRE